MKDILLMVIFHEKQVCTLVTYSNKDIHKEVEKMFRGFQIFYKRERAL